MHDGPSPSVCGNEIAMVLVPGHWRGITPGWIVHLVPIVVGSGLLISLLLDISGRGALLAVSLPSTAVAFALLLAAKFLVVRNLRARTQDSVCETMPPDDAHPRLVCYGDAVELERLRQLEVNWFEPFIVRRLFPRLDARTAICLAGVSALVMLAADAASLPIRHHWLLVAVCIGFFWGYPRLLPLFYRITPGRIELAPE